jgi:hypothetical protein
LSTVGLQHRGLRTIGELGGARPHGTRLRYMAGCKCFKCRRANSDYERSRIAARIGRDWNGIISADRARAHLQMLHRAGVGRRTIGDISGTAHSTIHEIRKGRKLRIRARTERRILAIAPNAAHIVPAARTHKLIREILEEGFSKAEVARRLGYRSPALQFNRRRVTARNEARVIALHSKLNV